MNGPHWLCRWLSLLLVLVAGPLVLRAQEPAAVRKTVLPSLDSQVAARMIALDRRLNPAHSIELAAALATHLASPLAPLDAFSKILADARNHDIWEQLPEEYYRMTQESGDTLVTLPGTVPNLGVGWSSGQVRRLCHQRLASLPRWSLNLYRQRVDAEAKALLEQGQRSRSPLLLRRLVDDLFCSSPGDQALDLLGDLAFEQGQFEDARHWWSLLTPLDGSREDRLLFPGPKVDLVLVQAKQILALAFQGRLNEAQDEITRFHQRNPTAKGHLAAQSDVFAIILQKTLNGFAKERIRNNDEPWTTFGGAATRNRTLSQGLSWQLWEDGPAWRVTLPSLTSPARKDGDRDNRDSRTRQAAFHPVIVNNQVLIADHRSVVSYHLITGKELFRYDLQTAGLVDPGPGVDAKFTRPRFTLSVDHQRAYVRLGKMGVTPKKEADRSDASYLVCLDLTESDRQKPRELWHVQASVDDKSLAFFEGSPLVHEGRVYIALSKLVGRRVLTSVVCYDLLGRRRWSREVCDSPEFEENPDRPRYRQHLLTWAGGQIVYCSHAGAIVAVDAWTGQPTWGVRYPSRGPLTSEFEPSPRDLTPGLYVDGRVFAAPFDTDRLFCLDAVSGRVEWELESVEIVHLLGAAHGRLYAATRTGILAVDSATGRVDWTQPTEGNLPSLGRGLLAGSRLIWPTQDAKLPYRAISLRSGGQQEEAATASLLPEPPIFDPTMLHTLPVGNLAFGQGCLVIAGLSELVVYVPAYKIQQLPPLDARPQARMETLYEEARRHASTGQAQEAIRSYRQLLDTTRTHRQARTWRTLIEGRLMSLEAAVQERKQPEDPAHLLERAERSLQAKRWGEAADAFRRLVAQAGPDDLKARDLLGLARAYEGQHDYRSAWLTWTELDTTFGGLVDPLSQKSYRALLPSAKREPYRSALRTNVPDGPALPLVRAWSHEGGRVWRTEAEDYRDDFFFCTQPGQLRCRNLADGAVRWQAALDFEPTQFGRWRDLVVVSGPDAARGVRVHDGQSAWSFAAPSRKWRLGTVENRAPKIMDGADGFVHVERWDDTLLLLDDQRRFLRIRLDTGAVAWQYASASAAIRPLGAGAFAPYFARVGDQLWVQSVTGQPYWLGTQATPSGTPSRLWVQPPLVFGNCIVFAGEQGQIFAQEKTPLHARVWTYKPPWTSSLTGQLCRLFARGSVLLALVPRNEGYEWIRLDSARGTLLWSIPAHKLPDDLDIESISIGDTSFYYAWNDKLYARSLNDGSLEWTQILPTRRSSWRIRYTSGYLAVHPAEASKDDDFSVSFLDPWKGSWLQRLTFPGARGPGEVLLTPGHVLISVGGRIFGFRSLDGE